MIKKFLILLFLASALPVAAQSPQDLAKKYNVTFPVAELGNCATLADCRTYCEDPLHRDTCLAFAKKKGFYHEAAVQAPPTMVLNQAKSELGCNSVDSCRQLCTQPANYDKCHTFAQNHDLGGGYAADPKKQEFLEKAKQTLGCDSYQTCKNFCDNSANQAKCSEFARSAGLAGGQHSSGPGGCTSAETCKAFCSDPQNYQLCAQYSSTRGGGAFSGPGGCNSEPSCRQYCQAHPQECGTSRVPDSNPAEMCSRTPGCSWTNNTCQCSYTQPQSTTHPTPPTSTTYPSYSPPATYDPALQCAKVTGCSWTGSTCQCSSPPPTTNHPSYSPPPGYDHATMCAKTSGCTWTNNTCQCPPPPSQPQPAYIPAATPAATSYPNPNPATECAKYPGCSWTGSTCQCPGVVHGTSSSDGLIQMLVRWLKSL